MRLHSHRAGRRGKHGSEGDYIVNRPCVARRTRRGRSCDPIPYDTIDWLVKNVPESNGKVGILGISYTASFP